jgi:hypothetical protein
VFRRENRILKKSSLKDNLQSAQSVPSVPSVKRKISSTGDNSEKGESDKDKLSDFKLHAVNPNQLLGRKIHREIQNCNFILNETLQQVSVNKRLLFNLLWIIQMKTAKRIN